MFIISKTIKGKEFMYSKQHMIKCKSKEQADLISGFLNKNNETNMGMFKLQDNEIWYVYKIDKYDVQPLYKFKTIKGKIGIVENY